jgi:hypothetical protein
MLKIKYMLQTALILSLLSVHQDCQAIEKGVCPDREPVELNKLHKQADTKVIWGGPDEVKVFFPLPTSHSETMNKVEFAKYADTLKSKDLITVWINLPNKNDLRKAGREDAKNETGKNENTKIDYINFPPSYLAKLNSESNEAKSILLALGYKRVVLWAFGIGQWSRYIVLDDAQAE